jgi:Type II restriction endonuclease EcoO109I
MHPDYSRFLAENVLTPCYQKRLAGLQRLALNSILKGKNPYLFRAKNVGTAADLVKGVIDAFLSSQEETVFGNLLENFAVYVAQIQYGGFKRNPPFASVDLEFISEPTYYIVGIKSGTTWGNADQIRAMRRNFLSARVALRADGMSHPIVAVNGCMYGIEPVPFKRSIVIDGTDDEGFFKYAGQVFWEFISGDPDLYRTMILPSGKPRADRMKYSGRPMMPR